MAKLPLYVTKPEGYLLVPGPDSIQLFILC